MTLANSPTDRVENMTIGLYIDQATRMSVQTMLHLERPRVTKLNMAIDGSGAYISSALAHVDDRRFRWHVAHNRTSAIVDRHDEIIVIVDLARTSCRLGEAGSDDI